MTDPRALDSANGGNSLKPLYIGIAAMGLTLIGLAALLGIFPGDSYSSVNILVEMLGLGTVAMAWVFGLSCAIRRTIFKDTKVVFLGVGIVLIGSIVPSTQSLSQPFFQPALDSPSNISALGVAAHLVGFAFITAGAMLPEMVSRIKGWTVILGAAILVTSVWAPLTFFPSAVQRISALTISPFGISPHTTPALITGSAWFVLSVYMFWMGVTRRRSLNIWLGDSLVAWSLSYLFIPLWNSDIGWQAISSAFGLLAMMFAILGIDFELEWSVHTTAQNLIDSLISSRVLSVKREIEAGLSRKRMHDIHNVLFSVEGATTLLQQDSLTPNERQLLSSMLSSQLSHLQHLIESPLSQLASTLESVWTSAQIGIDFTTPSVPGCAPANLCDMKLAGSREDNCRAIRLSLDHLMARAGSKDLVVLFEDKASHISISMSTISNSESKGAAKSSSNEQLLELYASELLLRRNGGWLEHRVWSEGEEVKLSLKVLREKEIPEPLTHIEQADHVESITPRLSGAQLTMDSTSLSEELHFTNIASHQPIFGSHYKRNTKSS